MFGAKFPLPVLSEKILYGSGSGSPAAGSTVYIYMYDQAGEHTAGFYNAIEGTIRANYLVTRTGLIKNLVVAVDAAPGGGQSNTYTVRINGAPTSVTCQIAGAAFRASDLVNTAKVVVGDRVTVELVTSAAASGGHHWAAFEMDTPSTRKPYEHINWGTHSSTIGANLTLYISSLGRGGQALTGGASAEWGWATTYLVTRKGTLKNLVMLAGTAPGLGETFVYTIRVNSVNTAMTVTLSGAAQLTGTDVVNVIQVDPGDYITLQCVTSLAAAVTNHSASFDFEEGDYRAG